MRKNLAFAALGMAFLFHPPSSAGLDVHLRLSSGLWRMNLGEVNTSLAGWRDGLKKAAGLDPGLEFIRGEDGSLRLGTEFEAEIVLSFSRWIKLGLSAGYGYASIDEKSTLLRFDQAGTLQEWARPTKVSAFPVLVSGYFNLPISRKFNAYFRAGVGAIQARYVSREGQKEAAEKRFTYPIYDNANASRITYIGGLGVSYTFDQSLGFFIEAAAKFARLDGFAGENKLEQKGNLYSYEEYIAQAGAWEPLMHVLPEEPVGDNIRNVREAVVDFGGYSIKIGLLLKF